jgi:cytochrome c nitrite reductase small subunit
MGKVYIIISIMIGIVAGLGAATFFYAKGYSYMSNDPEACKNCHIMNEQYNSWYKGSHRSVAVCNDCHTPKTFVGKWYTKALNGWNHSYAFTTGWFQEPIRANERNMEIAEDNCRYCHSTITSSITAHEYNEKIVQCTSCHRGVGHMK